MLWLNSGVKMTECPECKKWQEKFEWLDAIVQEFIRNTDKIAEATKDNLRAYKRYQHEARERKRKWDREHPNIP